MIKLINYILIILIKTYKFLISPILGQNCRFLPTCSEYFIESLELHGPLKGTYLGFRRITKCHPVKILGEFWNRSCAKKEKKLNGLKKRNICNCSIICCFIWLVSNFETPQIEEQKKLEQSKSSPNSESDNSDVPSVSVEKEKVVNISRDDAIKSSKRINFENENVKGTISLKGFLIDDILFKKYNKDVDSDESKIPESFRNK